MPTAKFTLFTKTNQVTQTHTNHDLEWDSPSKILNLSTPFTPSKSQQTLLERGLSFIPRPTKFDREKLQRDLHHFHRRLKLIDYFHLHPEKQQTPFTHSSHREPQTANLQPVTQLLIQTNRRALQHYRILLDTPDNLSRAERRALTKHCAEQLAQGQSTKNSK